MSTFTAAVHNFRNPVCMAVFCALPCVHVDMCVCVCGMCDVVTVTYFKIIYLKYLGLPL